MKKTSYHLLVLLTALCIACGPTESHHGDHDHPHPHPEDAKSATGMEHGDAKELGDVSLGKQTFRVVQLGELVPGKESAFELIPTASTVAKLASMNLYLWVESEDGEAVSASEKGLIEKDGFHFHCMPKKDGKAPHRVVVRLRHEGADTRAALPLDGHGHEHVDGPHHGVVAAFKGSLGSGQMELKLHDDKGDLELWLFQDDQLTKPMDLVLDAFVSVEFVDVKGRTVHLAPRDHTTNQDEDGKPNVRSGKTNYFVFPGVTDEDASWLKGKDFQSIVIVRLKSAGSEAVSEEFILKPHAH